MGAVAAFAEAEATGVVVVANSYEHPAFCGHSDQVGPETYGDSAFRDLCARLENSVFHPLIQSDSVSVFSYLRRSCFKRYVSLSMALRELAIDTTVIASEEHLFSSALDKIQSDESLPWPNDAKQETLFCMETLERAYLLVSEFSGVPKSEADKKKDKKLASDFALASLWCQFHADTLLCAVYGNLKPKRDVLAEIVGGLRTAVLAYANAREAYEIRQRARPVTDEQDVRWDAEDEATVEMAGRLGFEAQQ